MELPRKEIMQQMAKIAMEQATTMFAEQAREFAALPGMDEVSGRDALLAFADAISTTNANVWPAVRA
jgi:hypothetical protein